MIHINEYEIMFVVSIVLTAAAFACNRKSTCNLHYLGLFQVFLNLSKIQSILIAVDNV